MAKWSGKIGYAVDTEYPGSVHLEEIVEKKYYGDAVKTGRRWNDTSSVNGELTVTNQISIVSDPFALANFQNIRYAEFMGTLWKVTMVDVQYPRLLLTLGGVYNG